MSYFINTLPQVEKRRRYIEETCTYCLSIGSFAPLASLVEVFQSEIPILTDERSYRREVLLSLIEGLEKDKYDPHCLPESLFSEDALRSVTLLWKKRHKLIADCLEEVAWKWMETSSDLGRPLDTGSESVA